MPRGRRASRPPTARSTCPSATRSTSPRRSRTTGASSRSPASPASSPRSSCTGTRSPPTSTIDVFDKFGVNIGKSPRRIEGQSSKKVLLRIDDPGLYYVRVSGPTKADSSIYTMMVKYNGPVRGQAGSGTGARAGTRAVAGGTAAAPAPAPCPPGQNCPAPPDPNKVYGTVVSVVTRRLDGDAVPRQGLGGSAAPGHDGHDPRRARGRQAARGRQLLDRAGASAARSRSPSRRRCRSRSARTSGSSST